jgi:hypothetical protein
MQSNIAVLIGMAALALMALAAFGVYLWRQRQRVRRAEVWVRDFLFARYGVLPDNLNINCSDDPLWPVLVDFDGPGTGNRHSLQFAYPGASSTLSLLCEKQERR